MSICRSVLPWGSCDNWWNLATCVSPYRRGELDCWTEAANSTVSRTLCLVNGTVVPRDSITDPVREFWE